MAMRRTNSASSQVEEPVVDRHDFTHTQNTNCDSEDEIQVYDDPTEKADMSEWYIQNPPPLALWRIGGLLAILWCIPYLIIIPKTWPNLVRVILISANILIRTWFPSNYVPAESSHGSWISSPYLARALATLGEPVVLEA